MALLDFIKNKKKSDVEPRSDKALATRGVEVPRTSHTAASLTSLVAPHVTEKASMLTERGVYTFLVSSDATKDSVIRAVEARYKVTPTSVRILKVPHKRVFVRGKRGVTGGGRKAYVYLKKGEKIEIS